MDLYEIFRQIAGIEYQLMCGEINFEYDKLMCAMKPGHPADILSSIYCDVGSRIFLDHEAKIAPEELKKVYEELVAYKKTFKIKELAEPLGELKDYIESVETESGLCGM